VATLSEGTQTCERVEDEMLRIIDEAQKRGILLRAIGGLAIKTHCPSANHSSLERTYPDIDLVSTKEGGRFLEDLLPVLGYVPNRTFNTLNGDRRQMYHDPARGRQVDIFIGDFEMAHKIPMSRRLHMDALTVPLAEMFLTKAQIVELNQKDVLDLVTLLLDHEVGAGDQEVVNLDIVVDNCSRDWGLYTTVSMTIQALHRALAQGDVQLNEVQKPMVSQRLRTIQAAIDAAPKTLAWKMRKRLGKQARWYQEVEEVRR
jgi:hypothetical protein